MEDPIYVLKIMCYTPHLDSPPPSILDPNHVNEVTQVLPSVQYASPTRYWKEWMNAIQEFGQRMAGRTQGKIVVMGGGPHSVFLRIGMELRHTFPIRYVVSGNQTPPVFDIPQIVSSQTCANPAIITSVAKSERVWEEVKQGTCVVFLHTNPNHKLNVDEVPGPVAGFLDVVPVINMGEDSHDVIIWTVLHAVDSIIKYVRDHPNYDSLSLVTSVPVQLALLTGTRLLPQTLGKPIHLLDRVHHEYQLVWSSGAPADTSADTSVEAPGEARSEA